MLWSSQEHEEDSDSECGWKEGQTDSVEGNSTEGEEDTDLEEILHHEGEQTEDKEAMVEGAQTEKEEASLKRDGDEDETMEDAGGQVTYDLCASW